MTAQLVTDALIMAIWPRAEPNSLLNGQGRLFDCVERYYNPRRRSSTLGYLCPVELVEKAMLA